MSRVPSIRRGTLVTLEEAREAFPKIPGVNFPTVMNELELLDFGPGFNSEGGTLTVLPPVLGPSYKVFVPKPDEDGQDIAGIRPMEIRVPLGTPHRLERAGTGLPYAPICVASVVRSFRLRTPRPNAWPPAILANPFRNATRPMKGM